MVQSELHAVHRFVGCGGDGGEFGHGAQDCGQVDRCVVPGDALRRVVLREAVIGHLGDDDHRRARQVRLHDAERAGAGDEGSLPGQYRWPTGKAAVHVGHACCDLLARREYSVDALRVAYGLEDLDRVAPRNAIDVSDTAVDQRAHERGRRGYRFTAHRRLVYHRAAPGAGTLRPTGTSKGERGSASHRGRGCVSR